MRTFLLSITLVLTTSAALNAQDPSLQAAQQAAQIANQAAQQANQQAMRDAQLANQQAMQQAQQQAQQQSMACQHCVSFMPSFSVKSGSYSRTFTVEIKDKESGSKIYYTIDGWTPTAASLPYTGPITIDANTTLQAIAISQYGVRSRVANAVYTLTGVAPAPLAPIAAPDSAAKVPLPSQFVLAKDTPVPLVFASDVTSKTAMVGDKISVKLAEDLKAEGVVVVKKGTASVATITEVDKPKKLGAPGAVVFQADSLKTDGTVIKLRGGAAKEGQDEVAKAGALLAVPFSPVGLFVHGKDAEIKPGMVFTAFVDADTSLAPAN